LRSQRPVGTARSWQDQLLSLWKFYNGDLPTTGDAMARQVHAT
jgi:hypothetical protein